MKKLLYIGMICLTAFAMGVLVCCTEKDANDNTSGNGVTNNDNSGDNGGDSTDVNQVWMDLGLTSGTKWKVSNEENAADTGYNFFTLEDIGTLFAGQIPSREQFEELISECQWVWLGNGYNVTGPNGNSINLPALGVRDRYGNEGGVGTVGRYWSSTPSGSERTWKLDFNSDTVRMVGTYRCLGNSVRLIKN